jgi:hypothetical protein
LGGVCCKGKPIQLKADKANCGECGNVCAGQHPRCCSGFCKDVATDRAFCGDCDTICPDDSICVDGKCKPCTKPLRRCGNKCGSERLEVCCGGKLYDKDAYAGDVCCEGKMVKSIKCGGKPACPGTCCQGKKGEIICKEGEYCRFHEGCICPLGETKCGPPLPHP